MSLERNKRLADQPAFPVVNQEVHATGMDLRDFLAAKAIQAMIYNCTTEVEFERYRYVAKQKGMSVRKRIAEDYYKQAESMIKQSQK